MATQVIKTTFLLRRGQSSAWASVNPVLMAGEPAFELDTNKLKVGDGITPYNDLPYIAGENYNISADKKSVTFNTKKELQLFGYENAEVGQIPSKGQDGTLTWINQVEEDQPLTEEEILRVLI